MSKKEKKILLIEDDEVQVMMYNVEFSNFGYDLLVANNGKDGVEIAKKEKPDLIFLDLLLGNSSGVDVLKKIKANKENKDTKVLVMTNLTKKGLENECKELGALDFLIKSKFVPREIVEIAMAYLED